MPKNSKHGGKRPGAGRKAKWGFYDILRIGQACENRWRDAQRRAARVGKDALASSETELGTYWREAARIPVEHRRTWLDTEDGALHLYDFQEEITSLNEQKTDTQGQPLSPSNQLFSISTRPPKGTRKSIIEEVASELGLEPKQVDNIWQKYRRNERQQNKEILNSRHFKSRPDETG